MTAWGVETGIAVSLLIAAVLLLRLPVARLFGARAAYALWLAPLIRLVVPPLRSWPDGAPADVAQQVGGAMPDIAIITAPAGSSSLLPLWLGAIWLGGAIAYLAVQLWRHHAFIARALADGRALEVDDLRYDVVSSPSVAGPMATGLIHPLILVPADFDSRFTPHQQRLALLHEQMHLRRGDIWASAAALLVTALLWFNPLAHLALGAFRRDMEASCDASVIAAIEPCERELYAQTILRSAARPVPRSLCALTSLDELKGRLTMMTLNHGRGRTIAGLGLAGCLATTGLALTGPAAAADEPTEIKEIHKVVIKGPGGGDVIKRGGPDGRSMINEAECDDKVAVDSTSGGEREKRDVRIVICPKKGETPAQVADGMEKALARVEADNDLDPKTKADLKAKLEAKIRELRARG